MEPGPPVSVDRVAVQLVVYIDDEQAALDAVSEALGRDGVSVLGIRRPEDADAYLDGRFPLPVGFIVDGQIPGSNPDAFCRRLAERGIPYLRITAKSSSIAPDCQGLGSDGKSRSPLAKPVSRGMLYSMVRGAFLPNLPIVPAAGYRTQPA